MSDLSADALVEMVARAICDDCDDRWPADEAERGHWRGNARAALAAVAKAAGGREDMEEAALILTEYQHSHMPAALLHALAEGEP